MIISVLRDRVLNEPPELFKNPTCSKCGEKFPKLYQFDMCKHCLTPGLYESRKVINIYRN